MPGGPYRPRAPAAATLERGVLADPREYPLRSGITAGLLVLDEPVLVAAVLTSAPLPEDSVPSPDGAPARSAVSFAVPAPEPSAADAKPAEMSDARRLAMKKRAASTKKLLEAWTFMG